MCASIKFLGDGHTVKPTNYGHQEIHAKVMIYVIYLTTIHNWLSSSLYLEMDTDFTVTNVNVIWNERCERYNIVCYLYK